MHQDKPDKVQDIPRDLMTRDEVIQYLRLDVLSKNPVRSFHLLCHKHGLRGFRHGRGHCYTRSAVEDFIKARSTHARQ